ncbi:hypothetical protein ACLB2K_056621 [Fragaria x ananassa]
MPLLELEMTFMYILTQFSYFFLKMFGLSGFIAQIVAGILLGDVGFHRITEKKDMQNPMFTFTNQEILNLIALLGYTLFLFLIGVQIDLSLICKTGRKAVYVGVSNFLVPMMVGMGAVLYFHRNWPLGNGQAVQLLFATAIQCSTTLPVIASLLNQLKILNSELGRLGLSSVLISDLLYVFVVLIGSAAKSMDYDLLTGALNLGILVAFVLIVFYVGRPIMFWMIRQTPKGRVVKNSYVMCIMIAFLFSGVITHWCGMTVTAGPFILGLAVPSGPPLGSTLVKKLDFITNSVFMPVFVITCMMRVTLLPEVPRAHHWVVVATGVIIVIVFLSKFLASLVPALCCKMPVSDALALSLILSSQGVLEMAVYSLARDTWVITLSMYNALLCGVVINAIIIPPLLKRLYDPKRKYTGYEKRNISNCKPNSELRILACVTRCDNTPAIINLIDAVCPTQESPISVYVLHLIELVGRTTPIFISHNKQKRTVSNFTSSENVILSFDHFQRDNAGAVNVNVFTSITPAQYMHDDICTLALDKLTSLIILPFHRKWSILGSNTTIESENEKIREVNMSVLETAPCSVGILVNRGRIQSIEAATATISETFRVAMIFLGGNDDREALVFARRMAKDSCISLTVIHLLDSVEYKEEDNNGVKLDKAKWERLQEREMLRNMDMSSGNRYVSYVEVVVEDAAQTTTKLRSLLDEDEYDMFIVGRRHKVKSPQTSGLEQWCEFPELGIIGDLLSSTDSHSKASVLTVDELKYKLFSINYELESAKIRASHEISKNEEITKQLFHLLKAACQERDEAKDQLQNLLKMFLPIPAENETSPIFSDFNNENNQILQNASEFSAVKEPDVISKTSSYPTIRNFAVDSSNSGFPKNAAVQECDESIPVATMSSSNSKKTDLADVLIDNIVRVRPLPKKGRLFQAVFENEPLLQTLLVAPLPKWKNPPPIPPSKSSSNLIYGCDLPTEEQIEAVSPIRAIQESSSPRLSPIPSSSVLNFAHGSASMKTGVDNNSSDLMHSQIGTSKRRNKWL